jgi:hypothetical protein
MLFRGKIKKNYGVHRLVMRAFVGESSLDVNHIDGNKLNNKLSNLEYCTRKDNIAHSINIGLTKLPTKGHCLEATDAVCLSLITMINSGFNYDKCDRFLSMKVLSIKRAIARDGYEFLYNKKPIKYKVRKK